MSYEPEMLPDDIEHIDRRPSPMKKQKEKVIFLFLPCLFKEYYFFYVFKDSLDPRLCMYIRHANGFFTDSEFVNDRTCRSFRLLVCGLRFQTNYLIAKRVMINTIHSKACDIITQVMRHVKINNAHHNYL